MIRNHKTKIFLYLFAIVFKRATFSMRKKQTSTHSNINCILIKKTLFFLLCLLSNCVLMVQQTALSFVLGPFFVMNALSHPFSSSSKLKTYEAKRSQTNSNVAPSFCIVHSIEWRGLAVCLF